MARAVSAYNNDRAPNSKDVTLEDSARLLRRRKPRPKPVPEGQLALFGS